MEADQRTLSPVGLEITITRWIAFKDRVGRGWYRFRRNPISLAGGSMVLLVILLAILAPYVTPYPRHAGAFTDFSSIFQAPSRSHWFGTDEVGRDVFTRVIFGYRVSLMMAIVVLGISVPFGVFLGLVAGYFGGRIETVNGTGDLLGVHPDYREGDAGSGLHLVDMALPLDCWYHTVPQDGGVCTGKPDNWLQSY